MRATSKRPFTVVVEGNIGCGKTTFLQHFAKYDSVDILKEPVDEWRDVEGHNLLQLMYQDPKRWSLPFQSYVQLTMLRQHLAQSDNPIKLMERSIHSGRYCFVENLYKTGKLQGSEYSVLKEWYDFLVHSQEIDLNTDLIVYLRTDPETAMERLKSRARGEEVDIPIDYLRELHDHHEDWLVHKKFSHPPAPVIVIDANQDVEDMLGEYEKCMRDITGLARERSTPDVIQFPQGQRGVVSPAAL